MKNLNDLTKQIEEARKQGKDIRVGEIAKIKETYGETPKAYKIINGVFGKNE